MTITKSLADLLLDNALAYGSKIGFEVGCNLKMTPTYLRLKGWDYYDLNC
jgi:hypothetical protein